MRKILAFFDGHSLTFYDITTEKIYDSFNEPF